MEFFTNFMDTLDSFPSVQCFCCASIGNFFFKILLDIEMDI